jgi:hypothetical protein
MAASDEAKKDQAKGAHQAEHQAEHPNKPEHQAEHQAKAEHEVGHKAGPAPEAKARTVGRMDESTKGDELAKMLGEAEEIEIVFSDGEHEIVGIPPIPVTSTDFRPAAVEGLQLAQPGVEELLVYGPPRQEPAFQLAGYGLVVDGKQVAWKERGEPLVIQPGMTVNLANDVVF